MPIAQRLCNFRIRWREGTYGFYSMTNNNKQNKQNLRPDRFLKAKSLTLFFGVILYNNETFFFSGKIAFRDIY